MTLVPCEEVEDESLSTTDSTETSDSVRKNSRRPSLASFTETSDEWVVTAHPEPADIVQGELGTCWFLSALAVLADRRNLVENLFVSRERNEFGVYQVCNPTPWNVFLIYI